MIKTRIFLPTVIVTVINGWMLFGCIVGICPSSVVNVVPVLSIVVDPLWTRNRPLHYLTPWELVSKKVKCLLRGKDHGLVFVSICPSAKLDFCIRVVHTVWKYYPFAVLVEVAVIVPVNKSIIQTFGTASFFVNAVLTCR